jgi:hypothetical protein
MSELTKYKIILTLIFSLYVEIILLINKEYNLYIHLMVGGVFPIISWFVIRYSLNQYGKELEKNRKKITNNLLV